MKFMINVHLFVLLLVLSKSTRHFAVETILKYQCSCPLLDIILNRVYIQWRVAR